MARLAFFFFFNDTATTEIYTLSLHDALPIRAIADSKTPSRWLPVRSVTTTKRNSSGSRSGARLVQGAGPSGLAASMGAGAAPGRTARRAPQPTAVPRARARPTTER